MADPNWLPDSFWDRPDCWCARCWTLHTDVIFPHQCECGHIMEERNKHLVTFPTILIGSVHYRALQEIQQVEDQRVFDYIENMTHV